MSFKNNNKEYPSGFGIIGASEIMQNLFSLLQKVAKEDCPVLIQGETGTGKELVAGCWPRGTGDVFPTDTLDAMCGTKFRAIYTIL